MIRIIDIYYRHNKVSVSITDLYSDETKVYRYYSKITQQSKVRQETVARSRMCEIAGGEDFTTYVKELPDRTKQRHLRILDADIDMNDIPF